MTQSNEPTIEQMDITIARFMGMEGTDEFIQQNYQYHKSWELLMPVVEKIESIGNAVRIYTGHTTISTKDGIPICQIVDETKINATHNAVYQFITWLNQQKQPNVE